MHSARESDVVAVTLPAEFDVHCGVVFIRLVRPTQVRSGGLLAGRHRWADRFTAAELGVAADQLVIDVCGCIAFPTPGRMTVAAVAMAPIESGRLRA